MDIAAVVRAGVGTIVDGLEWILRFVKAAQRSARGSTLSFGLRQIFLVHYWWERDHHRRQRLVALLRLAVALPLAFAGLLPADAPWLTFALWGYAAAAGLLALMAWSRPPVEHHRTAPMVADIVAFATLLLANGAAATSTTIMLVLALLANAVVSGRRQLFYTSLSAAIMLLAKLAYCLAWQSPDGELAQSLELAMISLVVAAWSGVGLASPQPRLDARRSVIVPRSLPDTTGWPVAKVIDDVAQALQLQRVLLVWSDEDEPWSQLTLWQDGRLEEQKASPERFEPWVVEPLAGASFVTFDASAGDALVRRGPGGIKRWQGPVIHPGLVEACAMTTVVSVPVLMPTDAYTARLFLLDGKNFSRKTLAMAEVLAGRIAGLFEEARLNRELRRAGAAAERNRLARDLHDGVLQILAGTILQLRTLHGVIRNEPEKAVERLTVIEQVLTGEQRLLREMIRSPAWAGDPPPRPETSSLVTNLHSLIAQLQRCWEVSICSQILPEDMPASRLLQHDVMQILSEAVGNAARHGHATRVAVDLQLVGGALRLVIEDNGQGFPFSGTLDDQALERTGLGPRSLRERVVGRGGRITITSGDCGARLEVMLPRGRSPR